MKIPSLLGIATLAVLLGSSRPTAAQEIRVSLGGPEACVAADFGLRRGRAYGNVGVRTGRSYGRVGFGRVWVPARTVTRRHKIWVDPYRERIWDEPVYEYRYDDCGNRVRVLVRAGCWRWIDHPGRWEWRTRDVYEPGYWSTRGRRRR